LGPDVGRSVIKMAAARGCTFCVSVGLLAEAIEFRKSVT